MKYVIDMPDGWKKGACIMCSFLGPNSKCNPDACPLVNAKVAVEVTTKLKGNTTLADEGKIYFVEDK